MILLVSISTALLLRGYGFSAPVQRLLIATVVTLLLFYVVNGKAELGLGWFKATGAVAVLFAIFFVLEQSATGADSLRETIPELSDRISDELPRAATSTKALVGGLDARTKGLQVIRGQRPDIARFIDKAIAVEVLRDGAVAGLGDEYTAADRSQSKEVVRDVLAKMDQLQPHLADHPKFVLYYSGIIKRAVEQGLVEASRLDDVRRLASELRAEEVPYIGDVFRVLANASRRVAETTDDPAEKRRRLDEAKELLAAGAAKAQRPIDPILDDQAMANVLEVDGNNPGAFAAMKRCLDKFDNDPQTRGKNMGNYARALENYIRLGATTNQPSTTLIPVWEKLVDMKGMPAIRDTATLWLSLVDTEFFEAHRDDLIVSPHLTKDLAGFLHVATAQWHARRSDWAPARKALTRSTEVFKPTEYPEANRFVTGWLAMVEAQQPVTGNILAETPPH
jgi:hypothetical protein